MKQDYYQKTIEEIKKLIEIEPEKAYSKLEEELNMPYIPEIYEVQFLRLLSDVKRQLTSEAINNELSKDDVLEILSTNNSVKMPLALAKLADLNIQAFIGDIIKIFKKENVSNIILSIIYEYCVEQNIVVDLEWSGEIINPTKVGSIIKTKPYILSISKIEKAIQQNPTLIDVAKKQLELYSLLTFPSFRNEIDDLGNIIIEIAHEALGLPFKFNNTKRKDKIKTILKN